MRTTNSRTFPWHPATFHDFWGNFHIPRLFHTFPWQQVFPGFSMTAGTLLRWPKWCHTSSLAAFVYSEPVWAGRSHWLCSNWMWGKWMAMGFCTTNQQWRKIEKPAQIHQARITKIPQPAWTAWLLGVQIISHRMAMTFWKRHQQWRKFESNWDIHQTITDLITVSDHRILEVTEATLGLWRGIASSGSSGSSRTWSWTEIAIPWWQANLRQMPNAVVAQFLAHLRSSLYLCHTVSLQYWDQGINTMQMNRNDAVTSYHWDKTLPWQPL